MPDYSALAGNYGATQGAFSSVPNVVGDFFGASGSRLTIMRTVQSNFYAFGTTAMTNPQTYVFEADTNMNGIFDEGGPNDFFSVAGTGIDSSGDLNEDVFEITEPVPPTDAPTSPGAGFVFDGGTVTYTGNTMGTTAANGIPTDGEPWLASYSYTQTIHADIPTAGGGVVRRIKIAENNSPIPRHRIFFTYNFFNDVPAGFGDVNRYVAGFEKPFYYDTFSVDLRFPFASTLGSEQTDGSVGSKNTEFGNVTVMLKAVLAEGDNWITSGGVGMALPTSRDVRFRLSDGTEILRMQNEAVHFLPFLATLYQPSQNSFIQSFVQLDVASSGNTVNGDPFGGPLPEIGKLRDATLLMLDVQIGKWVYRNRRGGYITGFAPLAELHYTTTLEDNGRVTGNGFDIASTTNRFDVLNLTLGSVVQLGNRLAITPGMVIPLRKNDDKQFDFEAAVQANVTY